LIVAIAYLKFRTFKKMSWFDFFISFAAFVVMILSIFWPAFNNALQDDVPLAIMGAAFFLSWAFDRPIVHEYHQFDYRKDYAGTALFKVINNGLTLVWALIFLGILAFTYVTGERYVSVLYNLVFLGYFLTYFYPVMYITTNIKK